MSRGIRRLWLVWAAPPASDTAQGLRNLAIPMSLLFSGLWLMPFWEGPPLATPSEVVWFTVILYVVRQRDQARTELAALRKGVA
jgi:hypothetical protein